MIQRFKHQYYPKPKTEEITGFPGLKEVRGVGGRPRWVDSKGKIYEWDKQHGAVEVYDKTGKKHLGEFDLKRESRQSREIPGGRRQSRRACYA
ncbi:colicin E3/pyocin S6 family cytotoxin [Agrobacterium salinitolerans]|uniref:colicin E3/pyocin S6 family cytotoxin n=1 Tax=Agrobacterium salinitolerans TaxID=1183413 RepID=UPI0035B44750